MVPTRLLKAVRTGELSSDEFTVWVGLLGTADDNLEVVGNLATLMGLVGWTKSHDRFRDHLGKLRDRDLIEYESPRPGQRATPYRVRICGGVAMSYASESPAMRSSLNAGAPHERSATPHKKEETATHERRTRVADAPTEEKREEEKCVDDEEFESTIAPLGLFPGQRREALAAWHESPGGVKRCVAESLADGDSPPALFTEKIRAGEHRLPPVDGKPPLVTILSNWIRNEGRHYIDWSICEDEIQQNEERRGAKLTTEERNGLEQLWQELRVDAEESW